MLDQQPWQLRSGEMHPLRIARADWLQRIRMAKAMGLNTIALYLMWNAYEREPGQFDFDTGERDFVAFIRLCQQEGLWVYLRPGPYVCASGRWAGCHRICCASRACACAMPAMRATWQQ